MLAAETLDRALRQGDLSANYLRAYEQTCARALRPRVLLNSLLRFAIYRPALVHPLIRWSAQEWSSIDHSRRCRLCPRNSALIRSHRRPPQVVILRELNTMARCSSSIGSVRHAGENRHPGIIVGAYGVRPSWIPACAGMTTIEVDS